MPIDAALVARLRNAVEVTATSASAARAAHEAVTAALHAALGEPGDAENDLIVLKDAAVRYGKSVDQLYRWATVEQLGVKVGGKWYLYISLVRLHKKL